MNLVFSLSVNAFQRELAVISTPEGYFPQRLVVYEGEKIRVFFIAKEKASCLLVENTQFFIAAIKENITTAEATFLLPGRFKFYCPGEKKYGYITVLKDKTHLFGYRDSYQSWVPTDDD